MTRNQPFRFFDNREKYLQFVSTCGEKWAIAERIGAELHALQPRPPVLTLFDAGMGDGTVLSSVLRGLHDHHPTVPFLVIGKEISVEDLRMTLEKLPDRFSEHPRLVVAVTNMHYREAPALRPDSADKRKRLRWSEVALEGATAHEFDEQIDRLGPTIKDWWQVRSSPTTGNPVYVDPAVLVLFRADQRFLLDDVIPRPDRAPPGCDLVIAAQPYRARTPAETKVRLVLEPLARALAPGGRLIAIQSTGQDPGMEIIRKVWPDEDPFVTPGPLLLNTLCRRLAETAPEERYLVERRGQTLFRFDFEAPASAFQAPISTSTLLAAWNAAIYVAQIDDHHLIEAMSSGAYLEAARSVLERYGGLWFTDESFVVARAA